MIVPRLGAKGKLKRVLDPNHTTRDIGEDYPRGALFVSLT